MGSAGALLAGLLAVATLATACGDDGGDRRTILITQADDACAPAALEVTADERVTFEVHNESGDDQEIEGIEGTRLEEVLVPAGRTRNVNWTAPGEEGTALIKCYRPGGQETVIEVTVAAQ